MNPIVIPVVGLLEVRLPRPLMFMLREIEVVEVVGNPTCVELKALTVVWGRHSLIL
jgi:hypothetical protein